MSATKNKYIELQEELMMSGNTNEINELELLNWLFGGKYGDREEEEQ